MKKINPNPHTNEAKPNAFPPCLSISEALAAIMSPKIPTYRPARPKTVAFCDVQLPPTTEQSAEKKHFGVALHTNLSGEPSDAEVRSNKGGPGLRA